MDGGKEFFGGGSEKNKEKRFPNATTADQWVNAIFNDSNNWAKVDNSAYRSGEAAFVSGNRQELINSINELESQDMVLKDRFSVLMQVRARVKSSHNLRETMEMSKGSSGNFLFGSAGASKIADETQKVNKVAEKMKISSNDLRVKIGLLRGKLNRMNKVMPYEDTVPKNVKVTSDESNNVGIFNSVRVINNYKGVFKHENPVIGTKDIENDFEKNQEGELL
jgi:hypothetical protein